MNTTTITEDLALVYGVMLGDGCLSKVGKYHYFIDVCGHVSDDLPFLKKVQLIMEKYRGKSIPIKKRIKYGKIEMNFCDKRLFLLFRNLGFPIGKKGIYLSIPLVIPKRSMKFIVQGYFATDGCLVIANNHGISYPRIEFASISKKLLQQVLDYLRSIGMTGNLYLTKSYENHWNDFYRIQFNGKNNLKLFIKKIGFANPKHIVKFQKWKRNGGGEIRTHDL